ncbi:MAG: PIG-L family deacetylase [Anaerolineae bacterium]|nr:PIG-L family deacetylase [Anaerolineae bacterium]
MAESAFPAGGLMVIGAHAGDAENMAAATVLKHTRAGYPATIAHMTLGEAGHPTLAPEVYAEQRKREVLASAALMGAKAIWLPYRDGALPVSDAVEPSLQPDTAGEAERDPHALERKLSQGSRHHPRDRPERDLLCGAARHGSRASAPQHPWPLLTGELGGHGGLDRRHLPGRERRVGGLSGGAALPRAHGRARIVLPVSRVL